MIFFQPWLWHEQLVKWKLLHIVTVNVVVVVWDNVNIMVVDQSHEKLQLICLTLPETMA